MPDSARSDELTAQQRRAVQLLCTELSIGSVAKQLGINDATLRRWRKRPAFRAALRQALDLTYRDGLRLLIADQTRNLTEVLTVRTNADDPALRLRAAIALEAALSKRYELVVLDDLSQRIDDLEADIEADDSPAGVES